MNVIIRGSLLKQLRNIYGYSADDMCKKLEISRSYLSAIENNAKTGKQPSVDLLKKYADVFGIKLSSLMLLSEQYPDNKSKAEDFIRELMIKLINSLGKEVMKA